MLKAGVLRLESDGELRRKRRPPASECGYSLIEVVVAVAIVGVALVMVLSAVLSNFLAIPVLRSIDERVTLAQRVVEEIESGVTVSGAIPDRYAAMTAPAVFSDKTDYSYQVRVDDVEGSEGVIEDLRRVVVEVFKTKDGPSSSVKLTTIVRIVPR